MSMENGQNKSSDAFLAIVGPRKKSLLICLSLSLSSKSFLTEKNDGLGGLPRIYTSNGDYHSEEKSINQFPLIFCLQSQFVKSNQTQFYILIALKNKM